MARNRTAPPAADQADGATDALAEAIAKLVEFGATDEEAAKIVEVLGVKSVDDLSAVNEFDLTNTVGMAPIPARKLLGHMTPAQPEEPATSYDTGILPEVPGYDSLLEMLRGGGVLKVNIATLVAAVQASIADHAGLFTIPDKLAEAMLAFAKKNEEPVDPSYYGLKRQLTRRSYGDLFAAIEGFDSRSVTVKGKEELFAGINRYIWPATVEYFQVLSGWYDAWVKNASNPAALTQALARMAGGQGAVGPAIGQAPDTAGLRVQADSFNDAANRAFSGEGVQIAAAVAYDASEIRKNLSDSRLPSLIGAANYEQMLKELGVSVSAADPLFETNVTKFVMSILQVKNVAGGNDELMYFNAQYLLGSTIPWDRLGLHAGGPTGIGGSSQL